MRVLNLLILVVLSFCLMSMGFAAEEVALPGQGIADKILGFLNSGTGVMIIAAVVEFGLRFIKSEKALSLIYVCSGMFKMVGNLLTKLGEFSDKILPQKIK